MNIYIPVEIKARDLEGRLLMALFAAERGHKVLLGGKEHTLALAFNGLLKPGILHHKSLQYGQLEEIKQLINYSHKVTVQDEECGLLAASYTRFAQKRFSAKAIEIVDRVFTWGKHDHDEMSKIFSHAQERIVLTGSPRVDLWRQDMVKYYEKEPIQNLKQYILFVSNQGSFLNVNQFWLQLENARYWQRSMSEEDEKEYFRAFSRQVYMVLSFIQAIRKISSTFPETKIVVRPHPVQDEYAWSMLLGNLTNVIISSEGTLGQSIRNATVVVHEGCTSGFEAAAMGKSVIAYEAIEPLGEQPISNQISLIAKTENELIDLIFNLSQSNLKSKASNNNGAIWQLLLNRFANLEGELAAELIVKEWEKIGTQELEQANDWALILKHIDAEREHLPPKVNYLTRIKNKLVSLAFKFRKPSEIREDITEEIEDIPEWRKQFKTSHKFPPIHDGEIEALVGRFRGVTGRFNDVKHSRIGPRTFLFEHK